MSAGYELDNQLSELGGPEEATFTRGQILAFRARAPLTAPPPDPAAWTCKAPSRNRYSNRKCRCVGCREANRRYIARSRA